MGKTKVKRDEHGPYARFGGYIFRPVASNGPRRGSLGGAAPAWLGDGATSTVEGETIAGTHLHGVEGRVKRENGEAETWHAHGDYVHFENGKARTLPSHEVWRPWSFTLAATTAKPTTSP